MTNRRAHWAGLSDRALLGQCAVDTYRASGPGGQKRNKTSSAVRLRHPPTQLVVIAEESRSQHENRCRAIRRLRRAIYLHIREDMSPGELEPGRLASILGDALSDGRLRLRPKDQRFWPAAGLVLDVLQGARGEVRRAALALGLSTANLVSFLETDTQVWQVGNTLRQRFGRRPLRTT